MSESYLHVAEWRGHEGFMIDAVMQHVTRGNSPLSPRAKDVFINIKQKGMFSQSGHQAMHLQPMRFTGRTM
jgi:hypothetical protein